MNSFRFGLTIALALGAAALAFAQPCDPYRGGQYGGATTPTRATDATTALQRLRPPGRPYQIGFEDGRRDGERDSYQGHSFPPTHSGNFHHADRGYRREFGPKQLFKEAHRSGYGQFRGRRW